LTNPKARQSSSIENPTDPPEKTVGVHFHTVNLEVVTDGVLDKKSVKNYQYWDELLQCCKQTVGDMAAVPFDGRKTCAEVMENVMKRLHIEHRLKVPRPWLKILKDLRADGGPARIQVKSPERAEAEPRRIQGPTEPSYCDAAGNVLPEGVLRAHHSSLRVLQSDHRGLADIEPLLVAHSQTYPVPMGWTDGLIFLESLIGKSSDVPPVLIAVRDELQRRAEELHPELRQELEEKYRKRIKTVAA
jgi:hypothetical protein